jgi:endonuclease/exonuclease/phosphatase family metal-dependent hydrolase
VLSAHLALSQRGRLRQIAYLAELLGEAPHAVLMGDLNCEPGSQELALLCARTGLSAPLASIPTYPSWRPRRHIDHILATPGLALAPLAAPEAVDSDHLPVAAEIRLPGAA